MSSDDPLADWLRSRRTGPVPEDFSSRVMAAIDASPRPSGPGLTSNPPVPRDRLERLGGLLLMACSCVVAVVRLSSLAGLVVPDTEDRVITREFYDESEEVSRVAPDVT